MRGSMVALLAGFCLLAGCAGTPQRSPLDFLASGSWRLLALEGQVLEADNPDLSFDKAAGTVHGFNGCNRYQGSFVLDGDRIRFGQLGSTRMAGSPEAMAMEQRFMAALDGRDYHFDIAEQTLNFYDATGRLVMIFGLVR